MQLGIIPYAGLEIAFFEALKHRWERRRGKRLHPLGVMAAGAVASAGSQILTYPIALVRTRMQAQAASVPPMTMRSCIVSVARNDGFKGFYRVRVPYRRLYRPCILRRERLTQAVCLCGVLCGPFKICAGACDSGRTVTTPAVQGIQPNLLKMIPAAAIHWMAFDALKRGMGV